MERQNNKLWRKACCIPECVYEIHLPSNNLQCTQKTLNSRNDGTNIRCCKAQTLYERSADLPEEVENNALNYLLQWQATVSVGVEIIEMKILQL